MVSFFEYWLFFWAAFCIEERQCIVETFSTCVFAFLIFDQSDDFAKAIAFAWWPFLAIFKMLSFFEYLTVILRGRAGYELIFITNEAVGRVGYYQLISGKSEKKNCFSKFSSNSFDFFW